MRPGMDVDRMEAGSSDPAALLRAELMAVEPSPSFAAGVRARIQQRGAGSVMWLNAAAAVAVVAVTAVFSTARKPAGEVAPQVQATPTLANVAPAPAITSAPIATPQPRALRASVSSSRPAAAVFEVIVSPDQAMLISSYLAARARQARAEEDSIAIAAIVVPPVEIPLIKIEPLPSLSAANGGRNR